MCLYDLHLLLYGNHTKHMKPHTHNNTTYTHMAARIQQHKTHRQRHQKQQVKSIHTHPNNLQQRNTRHTHMGNTCNIIGKHAYTHIHTSHTTTCETHTHTCRHIYNNMANASIHTHKTIIQTHTDTHLQKYRKADTTQ